VAIFVSCREYSYRYTLPSGCKGFLTSLNSLPEKSFP
jgi:hypothetical protein